MAHYTTQQTASVRAAIGSDPQHGAVVPPIHLSSNFSFAGLGHKGDYDYTRSGNPTRDQLAEALATLEGGVGGTVTSSGMAAISLVLQLLRPGDRVLASHDCYGGTYRALAALADKDHFAVDFVDLSDPVAVAAALGRSPQLVWIETPSNPLLRITDIRALARRAHDVGAQVAVDNTFLSPVLQQPLALGADIVVHSTTKYLNGHSDVVGGAVIAGTEELHEELQWWANCIGLTGAPFDSYLTLRGVRTLHARMAAHESNASAVVDLLAADPRVHRVYHPSLVDHPGHEIAVQQQSGFGAMLSLELDGGPDQLARFVRALELFTLAESLGGVESLIAHPATMTHASMGPAARQRAGISDSLLRISVGIEGSQDLCTDLAQALDQAFAACPLAVVGTR